MHVSRKFYFFVCSMATLAALYVLVIGHFPLPAWVGFGVALTISWLYGFMALGRRV